MDNSNVCEDFEHDLAMLNYFQEEFMFRQKHYWDILIKLFALSIIVTILPITSEVFGISLISIHQRFLLIFPAIGLIISLCSLFLLLGEAKRIRAVNDAKYRINRQYMDEKYQYMFFNRLVGTSSDNKRKWMSSKTTWIVFSLQLIIIAAACVVMLYPN